MERSKVRERGHVVVAVSDLAPRRLVSNADDVGRRTVYPWSDTFAPVREVSGREFDCVEEVLSAAVKPFRRDQGEHLHVSSLLSNVATSFQRDFVDYSVHDLLGE